MSRRAAIVRRLAHLGEISDVLSAMKTLALLETHKLSRFLDHQQRLTALIEAAGSDFLGFHSEFAGKPAGQGESAVLWVVIGSDRGFCGDFNESVRTAFSAAAGPREPFLTVGRRLGSKFSDDPALLARLDGAVVAEEVLPILDKLMAELRHLLTGGKPWRRLAVVAHDAQAQPLIEGLLPFAAAARMGFPYPPQLQLPPADFYRELTEQYLLNKLTSLLCASLLAENRKRMEHMEGALHRMDAKIRELQLQRGALRQEEIVEEIEVILLSAESLMQGKRPSDDVLSKGGTVLSRIAR